MELAAKELDQADVKKQKKFVRKYRRHKREAGPKTRRYFVDACHPVWGVDLLYSCWLLTGRRFYVGVGNGRKRLNILGAYSPDDHDYVDLRLTKENITGEQFIKLLEALLAKHPDTEKFILYLDNARYYSKPVVKEWLAAHRQFHPVFLPAYSLMLALLAILGYVAIKEKTSIIGADGKPNAQLVVPHLFQQLFPSWFAGRVRLLRASSIWPATRPPTSPDRPSISTAAWR